MAGESLSFGDDACFEAAVGAEGVEGFGDLAAAGAQGDAEAAGDDVVLEAFGEKGQDGLFHGLGDGLGGVGSGGAGGGMGPVAFEEPPSLETRTSLRQESMTRVSRVQTANLSGR
ncbi:hypothetical protein [Streptomyces sp. NPDC020817]|uniref:hypothetical protein n=1 Tax=Streptomyces sp. NPDC020817 TaxID=3365095 RepID=UPI0037B28E9F